MDVLCWAAICFFLNLTPFLSAFFLSLSPSPFLPFSSQSCVMCWLKPSTQKSKQPLHTSWFSFLFLVSGAFLSSRIYNTYSIFMQRLTYSARHMFNVILRTFCVISSISRILSTLCKEWSTCTLEIIHYHRKIWKSTRCRKSCSLLLTIIVILGSTLNFIFPFIV